MTAGFARTLSDGRAGFPALLEAIEAWLEGQDVPPAPTAQLMIAFDEIISNVLNHGGGGTKEPTVDVSLSVADGKVSAEVADDGKRFDPLGMAVPDTTLSVEDRAIGGLGVHLVRQMMDRVEYAWENGRNHLRFYKDFPLD